MTHKKNIILRHPSIGFGGSQPSWVLHIANRPELDSFAHDIYRALANGEAADIIKQTSNHWRKVFSIIAKISFALFETGCETWQEYRDTKLLTDEGFEAISFEPYVEKLLNSNPQLLPFSIICGFTYAEQQVDLTQFVPHQNFDKLKLSPIQNVMVTPYFDWRQLNNEMLAVVINILSHKLTASK